MDPSYVFPKLAEINSFNRLTNSTRFTERTTSIVPRRSTISISFTLSTDFTLGERPVIWPFGLSNRRAVS